MRRPRVRDLDERFESRILPLFLRRTREVGDLLPELYLHGLSEGDFYLALRGLLGDGAPLSASSIARLIEAAQNRLAELGAARVYAFTKMTSYRFYQLGCGMVSTDLGHLVGLLGMNGYGVRRDLYFLRWPHFDPVESSTSPDPSADVVAKHVQGRGDLPDVDVLAHLGDRSIGDCVCESGATYARAQGAQRLFYVDWLGVSDEFQGHGWGAYLLRRALTAGRRLGYEHAAIAAEGDNHRALLLYTNYGFRVAGYGYDFYRDLEAPNA